MKQEAATSREVGFFHNPEAIVYPKKAPFSPSEAYPEYPFADVVNKETNHAYASVRQLLHELGYDVPNYGTKKWNPLGDIVSPGDKVVIKPNFVRERAYAGGDQESLITHGSIIRAVVDYVYIALKGRGSVVVGDAPIQTADFQKTAEVSGTRAVLDFYRAQGLDISLVDFRTEQTYKTYASFIWKHRMIGSAEDWVNVDMGEESELEDPNVDISRIRVSNYDPNVMKQRHAKGRHEYLINRHILEADVVLNLSKLKTHRLGGITCSMKNLVGVLAHKSSLAHYTSGSVEEGGDEYSKRAWRKKAFSWLAKQEDASRQVIRRFIFFVPRVLFHFVTKKGEQVFEGSWHQNDTMWRMVIDLNRAVLYADKKGKLQATQQRQYWCIVDGLIAGEKNGPLMPTNKPIGVLIGGKNPVAIDYTCATVMGFNIEKIKTIMKASVPKEHPLISFTLKQVEWLPKKVKLPNFHFIPHKNWVGYLEADAKTPADLGHEGATHEEA